MPENIIILNEDLDEAQAMLELVQSNGFPAQICTNLNNVIASLEEKRHLVILNERKESSMNMLDAIENIHRASRSSKSFLITPEKDPKRLADFANAGLNFILNPNPDSLKLIEAISKIIKVSESTINETQNAAARQTRLNEIPPLKYISAQSPHSYERVLLLHKYLQESDHIFIGLPEGHDGEFILREICHWKNYDTPELVWIKAENLSTQTLETLLKGKTPPAIGICELFLASKKSQESVLNFVKAQSQHKASKLKFIYFFPSKDITVSSEFIPELWDLIEKNLINLPPISERLSDLSAFINNYIQLNAKNKPDLSKISWTPEAIQVILAYPWPHNYEEVSNFLRRLSKLKDSTVIDGTLARQLIDNPGFGINITDKPLKMEAYLLEKQKLLLKRKLEQSHSTLKELLNVMDTDIDSKQTPDEIDQLNTPLYPELISRSRDKTPAY